MACAVGASEPKAGVSGGGGGARHIQERARHRQERRALLRGGIDLRQASNHGGIDERPERTVQPLGPHMVIRTPVDVERLVTTPAQQAFDERTQTISVEESTAQEDAERVHRVIGERCPRDATPMATRRR